MKRIIFMFVLTFAMCLTLSSCSGYEVVAEQPTARVIIGTYPSYYYYGSYYYTPRHVYRHTPPPPPPRRYNRPTPPPRPKVNAYRQPQRPQQPMRGGNNRGRGNRR